MNGPTFLLCSGFGLRQQQRLRLGADLMFSLLVETQTHRDFLFKLFWGKVEVGLGSFIWAVLGVDGAAGRGCAQDGSGIGEVAGMDVVNSGRLRHRTR